MKLLRGHHGDVNCLIVYNNLLISGGYDGKIRVWSLDTCNLVKTFSGHQSTIKSLCIYEDGVHPAKLISASWDHTIRLWNLKSGYQIHVLNGHSNRVKCCIMSPDHKNLVSCGDDCNIIIWNLVDYSPATVLQGHNQPISCLAFYSTDHANSTSPVLMASGSNDCTIGIWEYADAKASLIYKLSGHRGAITTLVFTSYPKINQLYSGSEDNSIVIWDLSSKSILYSLSEHTKPISQIVVLPYLHSEMIVSVAVNGTLKLHHGGSGELMKSYEFSCHTLNCVQLQAGSNDTKLIVGGSEGMLQVQRLEDIHVAAGVTGASIGHHLEPVGLVKDKLRQKRIKSHDRKSFNDNIPKSLDGDSLLSSAAETLEQKKMRSEILRSRSETRVEDNTMIVMNPTKKSTSNLNHRKQKNSLPSLSTSTNKSHQQVSVSNHGHHSNIASNFIFNDSIGISGSDDSSSVISIDESIHLGSSQSNDDDNASVGTIESAYSTYTTEETHHNTSPSRNPRLGPISRNIPSRHARPDQSSQNSHVSYSNVGRANTAMNKRVYHKVSKYHQAPKKEFILAYSQYAEVAQNQQLASLQQQNQPNQIHGHGQTVNQFLLVQKVNTKR